MSAPAEASVFEVTAAPDRSPAREAELVIPEGDYRIVLEDKAAKALLKLRQKDVRRFGKVMKAVANLATHGPEYSALRTTKMTGTDRFFSFAENGTPAAWRLYWTWGPRPSQILIIDASPALS